MSRIIGLEREPEMSRGAEVDFGLTDPGGVHQITPPLDLLDRTTLVDVDYQDCFIVDVGPALCVRTAEQWARAVLEEASTPTRRALVTGWKGLGLRLGPLSSDKHVLGWLVRVNDPDWVLLAADGRLGITGELLFERRHDTLRFATFVRLDNPAALAVWAGTRPVHEQVVRQLLTRVHGCGSSPGR